MPKIRVGETLSESFGIVRSHPIVMVPSVIMSLLGVLQGVIIALILPGIMTGTLSAIIGGLIVAVIVSVIIDVIVWGMYPIMTRNALDGKEIKLKETFNKVVPRLASLIGAVILAALITACGFILFIIPGIIFLVWFYFIIPAVMLSGESATGALSASKRFVKGKFWSAILLILVIAGISLIVSLFELIPYGSIITFILGIPLTAWTYIVPAYAYIKYAD